MNDESDSMKSEWLLYAWLSVAAMISGYDLGAADQCKSERKTSFFSALAWPIYVPVLLINGVDDTPTKEICEGYPEK